ncbi:MAG: Asp-tRNA(Asn)/Glu-tRNA(Gln) amidotransferase subunit GatC [Patescibacteria group bacterium]
MITKSEVEHIAKLARIKISEEEKELYTKQLVKILDYVGELKEVNTQDIAPTHHIIGVVNSGRQDKVKKFKGSEKILSQAPKREGNFWKVKAVLE